MIIFDVRWSRGRLGKTWHDQVNPLYNYNPSKINRKVCMLLCMNVARSACKDIVVTRSTRSAYPCGETEWWLERYPQSLTWLTFQLLVSLVSIYLLCWFFSAFWKTLTVKQPSTRTHEHMNTAPQAKLFLFLQGQTNKCWRLLSLRNNNEEYFNKIKIRYVNYVIRTLKIINIKIHFA